METAKGKTREEIINRLADRIDSFERYSQPHSKLMAELATRLARRLGLSEFDTSAVAEAALLHDIGLYAMSPAYCHSSAALSFQERLDLWRHPVIGEQQMAKREASRHAQLLVRWHHEWWNGSGYPDALAFEDIPIGARILRTVELFSAVASDRPYRLALEGDEALEALKSSAGIECDPHIVRSLVELLNELRSEDETAATEPNTEPTTPDAETLLVSGPVPQDILGVLDVETQASDSPQDPWSLNDQNPNVSNDPAEALLQPLAFGEAPGPLSLAPIQPAPVAAAPIEQAPAAKPTATSSLEVLLLRARSNEVLDSERRNTSWRGSRYNAKRLLGFEASVLSQIEFRSIAMPFSGSVELALYLKTWGKLILANDQRAWAAAVAHARVQARAPLGEEHIARVLDDVYVPGARLNNAGLRHWFGETDAWWMDNLRRNIESLEDQSLRAQALAIGIQAGDYALSFDDETRDLRMPLTTVYWRLAGRAIIGPATNPHSQSFNLPAEEFIKQSRADLLYLSLPASQSESGGSEARSAWREAWVSGTDESRTSELAAAQSRQSYLAAIGRLLRLGSQAKTWAVGCQETGLTSAQDIVEVIKEYRPVRATYSKDLTEVTGGLRNFIIVADRPEKSR